VSQLIVRNLNIVTGRFCIVLHDMSRMQECIQTRGKETQPITEELLNAIVAEHRT
jgi:hypothetical protein